ncbi:MAG: zinc ribbon domain-containing protein [Candidatus Methanoperedens sp.]|nr:zinc ribbon domain-containing protein [Candidatus Methanoperedens sp.]
MGTLKKVITSVFIVILIGVILLIPINTKEMVSSAETYYEKEPYTENEYYTVSEPYATTETYYEKEPFADTKQTTKNLVYNIANTECVQRSILSPAKNTYSVKNLDTEGGTFVIWVGFTLPDGTKDGQTISNYIQPSSSSDFTYTTNTVVSYCPSEIVSIPTKTITETFTNYRDVAKQRTVTKYRDVQKSREVTKFRDVPKQRTVWNQVVVQKPLHQIIPPPLLGFGSVILLILGIVVLRRGRKYNQEVISPSDELESVPLPLQLKEQPKKSPPKMLEEKGTIDVKSAFGYKGATILYKVKVENTSPVPIADIKTSLFVPNVFLLLEKEKSLALLKPGESKTVTFDIRPTGECGDCEVSGKVVYYDTASNRTKENDIESKMLSIVCPMLKVKEISESDWHNIVSNLLETEESTKEIDMPAEALFTMVSRIIKDMHMHMHKPEITQNQKLFNGVARFYGEGVKGLKYAAQVEVVGGAKKSKLILKAWAEKEDALTGFYHGILDEIEKRINVKEYIDDNIVQYNVHIGDKIGTLVKDSVVQRSTIGASVRKCPNCGREVEANGKFCLECGAKL